MVPEVVCFSNFMNSSKSSYQNGSSSKMFPDSSTQTQEKISSFSSKSWMNSGIVWRGKFSMRNTLEHPSVVEECSFYAVMEKSAPLKYFLNTTEVQSLIGQGLGKRKTTSTKTPQGVGKSSIYTIQHAGIGRKASAGPQAKGYRNDGETYTLDSRGSSDAVCKTNAPFRVRNITRVSKELDSSRWVAAGNAVNTKIVQWIGKRVLEKN